MNFLYILALVLLSGPIEATTKESPAIEADQVRQARYKQNQALLSGDVELAASFWTDDITLRRGLGSLVIGKDAYRALIETIPDSKSLIYVREPDSIEVSSDWPLAYESGSWTAHYHHLEGPIALSGRYCAQWVKREGDWLIRSEIFVALTCHDKSNNWPYLP